MRLSPLLRQNLTKENLALIKSLFLTPTPDRWFYDPDTGTGRLDRKQESQKLKRKLYQLARDTDLQNTPHMLPVVILKAKAFIREFLPEYVKRLKE